MSVVVKKLNEVELTVLLAVSTPSSQNTLVLLKLPVGSSASKYRLTPELVRFTALTFCMLANEVKGNI